MTPPAPQIGFDRFIALEWAVTAMKVRAGLASRDDLTNSLNAAGLTQAALRKTRTVLNRLWLEPRGELADFADRGIAICNSHPSVPRAALTWGMAIAAYPFFGKVAEVVGRLSALQGDCAAAEVHRRMSETYGEREGTYRMTNMILQSQADWGAIERTEKGKRLIRKTPVKISEDVLVSWLVEAALRYAGKSVSVPALQSMPVIYPYVLARPLAYVLSNSPNVELRMEASGTQLAALHSS